MLAETTWMLWTSLVLAAEPAGTVTITKPAVAPVAGVRHYVVEVRIIEVDERGREKVVAQPVLQTAGAAAGVTLEGETGRRFEFHFSAAEPGAPTPLAVMLADEPSAPRPIAAMPPSPPAILEQRVTVKAVQQPRKEVLRNVARQAGLTVAMEPEIAEATAAKMSTPISFNISDAPLNEVLKQLVEPLDLGYAVRQDLVLIGFRTLEAAQAEPAANPALPPQAGADDWQIRVYDVSDLVSKTATGQPDFGPLLTQLQLRVSPDSWSSTGGQGTVRGFASTVSLVIRQTSSGHAAVAEFLDRLRKAPVRKP